MPAFGFDSPCSNANALFVRVDRPTPMSSLSAEPAMAEFFHFDYILLFMLVGP